MRLLAGKRRRRSLLSSRSFTTSTARSERRSYQDQANLLSWSSLHSTVEERNPIQTVSALNNSSSFEVLKQKELFDNYLAKELAITSFGDWYRVTNEEIESKGGRAILTGDSLL